MAPIFPLNTTKPRYTRGFAVNGGVVNLNGIKHTKSQTIQSQITGNLQGILPRFFLHPIMFTLNYLAYPKIPPQIIREFKIKNRENQIRYLYLIFLHYHLGQKM